MHSFAAESDPVTEESALAPLRRRGFRAAWTALAGSQLVIWMNTVGAVTVIAALSDSPTLIALVQTANSVPAVLLALLIPAPTPISSAAGRARCPSPLADLQVFCGSRRGDSNPGPP